MSGKYNCRYWLRSLLKSGGTPWCSRVDSRQHCLLYSHPHSAAELQQHVCPSPHCVREDCTGVHSCCHGPVWKPSSKVQAVAAAAQGCILQANLCGKQTMSWRCCCASSRRTCSHAPAVRQRAHVPCHRPESLRWVLAGLVTPWYAHVRGTISVQYADGQRLAASGVVTLRWQMVAWLTHQLHQCRSRPSPSRRQGPMPWLTPR